MEQVSEYLVPSNPGCYTDDPEATTDQMSAKQILASLRKQRKAIDAAISALEKISARSTKNPSGSRRPQKPPASGKLAGTHPGPADIHRTVKVIEFPGSNHAA
jgi:hypothetical protein